MNSSKDPSRCCSCRVAARGARSARAVRRHRRGSVAQLVQQVQTLEQQLQTAQRSSHQAQAHYQSMTGGRGMEQLLERHRPQLSARPTGGSSKRPCRAQRGAYTALGRRCAHALAANAVLTRPHSWQLVAPAAAGAAGTSSARCRAAAGARREQALANCQRPLRIPAAADRRHRLRHDQKGILDLRRGSAPSRRCCRTSRPSAGSVPGGAGAAVGRGRAGARADRGRHCGVTAELRHPLPADAARRTDMGFFSTFWTLAQRAADWLHRRQHRAGCRARWSPRSSRWHRVRHGLGLPAAHRADRGADHRRAQAHRHAGRHPRCGAAPVALQRA